MTNFLIKKVAYGNGVFIATTGDKILKSANGKNWSEVGLNNSNNTEDLSNVIFADGKFLVSGGTYYYISSDNGTTWNEESYIFEITDSTYGDGNFMLVSPNGGCFKINTTTLERTFFTQNLKAVTYFKDTFYGVLNDTENDDGLYRLDGENWTKIHNGLHPGDVCLRGIKNDLYMTVLGMTFIFVWDEEGNVTDFTIAQDYPDAMVDGMEVNGTIYLLTNYCLCEDTSPVLTSNSEDYKCICIDEKNTIYVFSSSNVVTYNVRPVINSIAYGNGVYMAVAGEQVLKSIDGENWETIKTLELNNNTGIVAFGDNVFVVCAGNHYYATKNNGITWTENEYFGVISSICFGDGNFYIAGTNETISIDSETLEVSTANIYSGFASIEYLDGKLYGITTLGSKVWVLNDGQWAEIYSSDDVMDIDYRYLTGCNNRLFLGTSTATYEIVRTPQNASYNLVQLNTSGKLLGSCALNGRCYLLTEMGLYEDEVLVETFGEGSFTAFCANGNTSAFLVAQCINRAVFLEYISAKPYFNIQNVAYSNGTYIAAAGDRILRSTDGENWETVRLTNKTFEDNQLTAVVADNGKFIVSGEMVYYISSDNGITWTEYGSLIPMRNLAYGDGNFMLCSDEFDNTLIIDSDTMSFNWAFPGVCMNDIAFANGAFYGIKYSENGSELCKYDFAGNSWIPFVTDLTLAENPKLFSAGDRLFLGNNGATYEFTKNTEGEFSAMTSCAYIDGEVIDACKSGEEIYILTADRMYQGTILTNMFTAGNYTSILNIPVDDAEKLAMFDGKEFSIFEPIQPVTEYRIKSVAYNDGVYVAAAGDKVLKSFDCENWFQVKSSEDVNICKVVFGDGIFLVCGGHNYYISKDNGITWIEGTTEGFMQYAAYGDGRFIITSDTDKTLQIDSETLKCTVLELSIPMGDVGFWEGKFVAVKTNSLDNTIFVLENDTWLEKRIANCPIITEETKTLCSCNNRLFIGLENSTVEIVYENELFKIRDLSINALLIDTCNVEESTYILTSSTLYENDNPVRTSNINTTFTCCVAGKSLTSPLLRSTSSPEYTVNIISNSLIDTSEKSSINSYKPGSKPILPKKGKVTYTVVADTHNSPSGKKSALFDLGDNTLACEKDGPDPINYPNCELRVYGNHDVAYLGYVPNTQEEERDWIWRDRKNHVAVFGLNSCSGQHSFVIPKKEINELAEQLNNLDPDWDVIILTHVPLFEKKTDITGACWTESAPENARSLLLPLLTAYHNHGEWGDYDFSDRSGYVIGCFSGHVHNGIIYTLDGIYMEAFTTNGAKTCIPKQGDGPYNAGLYNVDKYPTEININFNKKTVNDVSYVSPPKIYRCKYQEHPTDLSPSNKAEGIISLDGVYYPKFTYDGTYLGFSKSPIGGPTNNSYTPNKPWELKTFAKIYVNDKDVCTTSKVFFTGNGTLAYYYGGGILTKYGLHEIDYENNDIHFYANGFRWNFKNGKYVFDLAEKYKFSDSSGYYPVFGQDNRYIGWGNGPESHLVGIRKNSNEDVSGSSTRSWILGGPNGTFFKVKDSLPFHHVTDIIFDENGLLYDFYPDNYKLHTSTSYSNGLEKIINIFTIYKNTETSKDVLLKWTFSDRLFQGVSEITPKSIKEYAFNNYTSDKIDENVDWMNFTDHTYYFKFENGYLKKYQDTKLGSKLTDYAIDDPVGWNCHQTVYYCNSLKDVITNNYDDGASERIDHLYFSEEKGKGYYLNSLNKKFTYAIINGYVFKQIDKQSGKWLLYNIDP